MSRRTGRSYKGKTIITDKVIMTSLNPVMVQDWIIKVSGNDLGHILLALFNPYTKDSCVHYFTNEVEANQFISTWIEKHSSI